MRGLEEVAVEVRYEVAWEIHRETDALQGRVSVAVVDHIGRQGVGGSSILYVC